MTFMREAVVGALNGDQLEMANILRRLGVQINVAKLITYLAAAGESTSREIEMGAGLRQPEVSIAMRTLRRENWVREHDVKTEGKGRPHKVYVLATPLDEIIRIIEEDKRKNSAQAIESVQKLRDLATTLGGKATEA
jgi:predicted transcriptional regulator